MCYFSIVIRACSIVCSRVGPSCHLIMVDFFGMELQWLGQGQSESWCYQVDLWWTVQVYISIISQVGSFLIWFN